MEEIKVAQSPIELEQIAKEFNRTNVLTLSRDFYPHAGLIAESIAMSENIKNCQVLYRDRTQLETLQKMFPQAKPIHIPSKKRMMKWYDYHKYRVNEKDYQYVFLMELSGESILYLLNQWFNDKMGKILAYRFIIITQHNIPQVYKLNIDVFTSQYFDKFLKNGIYRQYHSLSETDQKIVSKIIVQEYIIPYILRLKANGDKFGFTTTYKPVDMDHEIKLIQDVFDKTFPNDNKFVKPKITKLPPVPEMAGGVEVDDKSMDIMMVINGQMSIFTWLKNVFNVLHIIVIMIVAFWIGNHAYYFFYYNAYDEIKEIIRKEFFKETPEEEFGPIYEKLQEKIDGIDTSLIPSYNKKYKEVKKHITTKYPENVKNIWFYMSRSLYRNSTILSIKDITV